MDPSKQIRTDVNDPVLPPDLLYSAALTSGVDPVYRRKVRAIVPGNRKNRPESKLPERLNGVTASDLRPAMSASERNIKCPACNRKRKVCQCHLAQ